MNVFKISICSSLLLLSFASCKQSEANTQGVEKKRVTAQAVSDTAIVAQKPPALDTAMYDSLQRHLTGNHPSNLWPVKTEYPLSGAVLPFKRIVAYYGNFYSKGMGILGALPEDQMLQNLQKEVKRWAAADPAIPVQAAIHYIAVTAQHSPGQGNKYRLRMPASQIEKAIAVAKKINALVFLDIQIGHSSLAEEIQALEPYLKMPDVHLGIDPEFAMKGGQVPSSVIGTFDAADVNLASKYLQSLVVKNNLPPKILVVHRFTKGMLTNYKNINKPKEVQIVIDMDGWGFPAKKKTSYNTAVTSEPVQFAGFKLFYKNDVSKSSRIMEPSEVLALYPSPIYIQYQ